MTEHDDKGVLRNVAWTEVLPWLIIFRTFRVAIGIRALLMGAAAVFLTVLGWSFLGTVFSTDTTATAWLKPYAEHSLHEITQAVRNAPPGVEVGAPAAEEKILPPLQENPYTGSWLFLIRPAYKALSFDLGPHQLLCLLLCGLWSLAVWAFFGAAISRIAAVQLAAYEHLPGMAALRFVGSRWLSYFGTPLFPAGGVSLAAVPVFLLSLLINLNLGLFLAGLCWGLLLVFGLIMAFLLLGPFFGWPLMWPTISTEGSDAYDVLSRSYAYVYQRPLHYVFYVAVRPAWDGWAGFLCKISPRR